MNKKKKAESSAKKKKRSSYNECVSNARKTIKLMAALLVVLGMVMTITSCGSHDNKDSETTSEIIIEAETNPYDDSGFKLKDGFMIYDDTAYETSIGIDVSEWSLDIDWDKVKASGVSFVICRVGYRGYETGKFAFDTRLDEYLNGAYGSGLKTGVYFVTQAIDEEEAREEAREVISRIKGHNIEMPVYIDCEANNGVETRTDDLTKEEHTQNALAFIDEIEKNGYRAGIYSNETWIHKNIDIDQFVDHDIWFAKYTDTPSTTMPFNMWQYSADGSIDGISTDVDMNIRIEKK